MLSSSVPLRFADHRLADYDPSVSPKARLALEAADEFVGGGISGLVLVGPPGVGKTHIAAGIVNEIRVRNAEDYARAVEALGPDDRHPRLPVVPLWANVASMLVQMRFEIGRPPDDQDANLLALKLRSHPAPVVLDDLGREKASDWTTEAIYTIVNERYDAKLPTIITSNMTVEHLQAGANWPTISRIAEDGRLIAFRDTPDYRLRRG